MRALKIGKEIELLIALVAAVQGFYLSIISFLSRKRSPSALLLSVVFFSVTLRIVKSLLWVYAEDVELWVLNFGFLAHSVYGPALFLYIYCELYSKKWTSIFFIHFVPSLFLLLTLSSLTLDRFWYSFGYSTLLIHQGLYIVATWIMFLVGLRQGHLAHTIEKERKSWYMLLLLGGFLLQLAYFSNYILGLTPYLMGPVIYAIFLFVTSIYVFKYPQVLSASKGNQNIAIAPEHVERISKRLLEHMKTEQPFLNPNCTLGSLAKEINVQPYKLSYLINKEFDQNFSTFLNTYRIQKAMQLLQDENYRSIKISAIAFDCGFNSLSSFNTAFKKATSQTPSEFRAGNNLTDL
ncbi:helix-turn-helix domain-containing protein [Muricauda sp. JGD-17]|uniref:Helix-turn-helix domain-containing protein n=1 Tax=Flagellimonas ochracea TaxID=2696472 RepID=A0A964TDW4_9FLAO|nr:helix-turn-helix transcriptional regulator [Allomuricauda ochracea]NAY92399.1 helix-turn-helix domain-containing protein [Allomuricauda ochracea]